VIDSVLATPWAQRRELGMRACDFARREWSWETVADKLLGHASAR
jgi:hypothetical protein